MPYSVTLKQFEGPLDLLLHLIEKAEMDIRDVFVSEITSQYLEYINAANDLDMELASEFLTMAATLLYIKSRSLLPKPPRDTLDEIEEDPEIVLMRQLREYRAYKDASQRLDALREETSGVYSKLPEEFILPEDNAVLVGGTIDDLHEAFMRLLSYTDDRHASKAVTTHEVSADYYTVQGCISEMRDVLREKQRIEFFSLFGNTSVKLKIIVMFMALLEMIMRGEVYVFQSGCFENITIAVRELSCDDAEESYLDEYNNVELERY